MDARAATLAQGCGYVASAPKRGLNFAWRCVRRGGLSPLRFAAKFPIELCPRCLEPAGMSALPPPRVIPSPPVCREHGDLCPGELSHRPPARRPQSSASPPPSFPPTQLELTIVAALAAQPNLSLRQIAMQILGTERQKKDVQKALRDLRDRGVVLVRHTLHDTRHLVYHLAPGTAYPPQSPPERVHA